MSINRMDLTKRKSLNRFDLLNQIEQLSKESGDSGPVADLIWQNDGSLQPSSSSFYTELCTYEEKKYKAVIIESCATYINSDGTVIQATPPYTELAFLPIDGNTIDGAKKAAFANVSTYNPYYDDESSTQYVYMSGSECTVIGGKVTLNNNGWVDKTTIPLQSSYGTILATKQNIPYRIYGLKELPELDTIYTNTDTDNFYNSTIKDIVNNNFNKYDALIIEYNTFDETDRTNVNNYCFLKKGNHGSLGCLFFNDGKVYPASAGIQWHGKHVIVENPLYDNRKEDHIYKQPFQIVSIRGVRNTPMFDSLPLNPVSGF